MHNKLPIITRRRFLSLLGGIVGASLTGCGKQQRPLTIVSQFWPGYELMFLAQREGWLTTPELRLIKTSSSTESLRALSEGAADGAALTLDEVLRQRAQGIPLTIVLVFDESAGADALLVRPGIEKLTDLAGKRIGVEKTALGSLMLDRVLAAAGLPESAVTAVQLTIDEHLKSWREGSIDALITFEPVVTQLQALGAKRLFDSRQIPGLVLDVLAIHPDAAKIHAKTLRKLVAAHFRALDRLNSSPQDTAYRMANSMGLDGQEVLTVMRGLELPDSAANQAYLAGENGSVLTSARQLSALMIRTGLLSEQDDLSGLINRDFLPR